MGECKKRFICILGFLFFLYFFCYIHTCWLRAVSNTSIPIMVGIFQLIFLVIVFRPVSDIFLNIISALRGKFDSRLDKSDKKAQRTMNPNQRKNENISISRVYLGNLSRYGSVIDNNDSSRYKGFFLLCFVQGAQSPLGAKIDQYGVKFACAR